MNKMWWVYVIQSSNNKYYVGSTTDPYRRLRQHNGEIKGGAKSTRSNRPWKLVKVYGHYANRSEAFKAELSLKRGKRGISRTKWQSSDSEWYRESEQSQNFCLNFVSSSQEDVKLTLSSKEKDNGNELLFSFEK